LAPAGVGRLLVPTLFLELTEDAFLGQLALEQLDGLLDVVVHDLDLH
jgi:hypothetical protein